MLLQPRLGIWVKAKYLLFVSRVQIQEQRIFATEVEFNRIRRAIAVFGHDDFRNMLILCFLIVIILPVEKGNNIRILFQRPRFAEVTEHGPLVLAAFYTAAELGKGDKRYFQLSRQRFQ